MNRFEHDVGARIRGKRGEYRVKDRLGAGGMGACYLVEDTDVRRSYVLKIMHSSVAARPSAMEAFNLEGRGLVALHTCPNIVQAYQIDATPAGIPFYLMEVLAGQSLRAILRRHPRLSPANATKIGSDIAKALVFAHDKQIVHCDLKPENVMVVASPEGALAKLIDFGVMKANLVRAGFHGAAGTPAYMAPEQLRGEQIDGRADLFALGVMIYEMVVGHHPFVEEGLDAKGAMARIDRMPAPLAYAAKDLPWQIINPMDDLLERLLAPKRADRFADASDVQVRLHRVRREVEKMEKGDVHAASTNPAGTPQELIDQITGAIDSEAIAPMMDSSRGDRLAGHIGDAPMRARDIATQPDAVAAAPPGASAVGRPPPSVTAPPAQPLPRAATSGIAYVAPTGTTSDSYQVAHAAAKLLANTPEQVSPAKSNGLDITAAEREHMERLLSRAAQRAPNGDATVVEDERYERRIQSDAEPPESVPYVPPWLIVVLLGPIIVLLVWLLLR